MHEHNPPAVCAHELRHCAHCDVVFCEKCKHEWKKPSASALPQYPPGVRGPFDSPWDKPSPWKTYPERNDKHWDRIRQMQQFQNEMVLCSHDQPDKA
jgi:hypothetical protein